MATENIVLLGSAAILCSLHLFGGPLSGLVRKPRGGAKGERAPESVPPSRSSASLSAEVPPLPSQGRVL